MPNIGPRGATGACVAHGERVDGHGGERTYSMLGPLMAWAWAFTAGFSNVHTSPLSWHRRQGDCGAAGPGGRAGERRGGAPGPADAPRPHTGSAGPAISIGPARIARVQRGEARLALAAVGARARAALGDVRAGRAGAARGREAVVGERRLRLAVVDVCPPALHSAAVGEDGERVGGHGRLGHFGADERRG
jgi:hypothetical protein